MKHRSVVASFIFKDNEHGDTVVALFRRSHHPDLHTYQGKLAPVSGSIDAQDADALAAAARELHEETQLAVGRDLRLAFCGTVFSFVDQEAQQSWTVHPFGWTLLADESKIKLDWEHSAWEWIRPQDIVLRKIVDDCVPRLDWSFRRVYFGPGGIFSRDSAIARDNAAGEAFLSSLERLRTDQQSGARVLATEAVQYLSNIAREMTEFDWSAFKTAAYHLVYSGRPSMNAAISSAVLTALRRIEPKVKGGGSPAQIATTLEDVHAQRRQTSHRISSNFTTFIHDVCKTSTSITFLTLSSSSTISSAIIDLLTVCPDLTISIKILESRPLCEGVSMAASLLQSSRRLSASHRLQIHLAPDTHMARFAQDLSKLSWPSFLILGADRISPSGHVSNKTGSYAAATVTKRLSPSTAVLVLSDTDKIAKPSDLARYERREEDPEREISEHAPENNDVSEVSRIWAVAGVEEAAVDVLTRGDQDHTVETDVEIENVYFEWFHRDLIDVYISEDGVLSPRRIRELSLDKARLEKDLFGDL